MHRIVIVGGGAGGLALTTQLGKHLGKKGLAEITLVDAARTHAWKPLLHQLAAGSFDTHAEEIEYLVKALPRLQRGEPVSPFVFRDQGSLVSLSEYSSVGSLMGSLTKGSFLSRGNWPSSCNGPCTSSTGWRWAAGKKTALITLSEMIDRTYRPRIKLH